MFVDNSGRRARLLRRIGLSVGAVCVGYTLVLGMAFMGWGTSLDPSSLLPLGRGPASGTQAPGPRGVGPRGGTGTPPVKPTGAPPTASPTPTPSASTSAN